MTQDDKLKTAEEELARMNKELEFPEIKGDHGWTAESLEDATNNIQSFSECQKPIQIPSVQWIANLSGIFVTDAGFAQQSTNLKPLTSWASRKEPTKPQRGEGML